MDISAPEGPGGRQEKSSTVFLHKTAAEDEEDEAAARSHHLLWFWDRDATEELVVAEDLLMPRDQISCRRQHKITNCSTFIKNPHLPSFARTADLTQSLSDQVQLVHVRLPGPQRDP